MILKLHTFKSDSALSRCVGVSAVTVGMLARATTAKNALEEMPLFSAFFLSYRGEA